MYSNFKENGGSWRKFVVLGNYIFNIIYYKIIRIEKTILEHLCLCKNCF